MKKTVAMIALSAICFGNSAFSHSYIRNPQDTLTKTKIKKKNDKVKVKKKLVKKDTTASH